MTGTKGVKMDYWEMRPKSFLEFWEGPLPCHCLEIYSVVSEIALKLKICSYHSDNNVD